MLISLISSFSSNIVTNRYSVSAKPIWHEGDGIAPEEATQLESVHSACVS